MNVPTPKIRESSPARREELAGQDGAESNKATRAQ